MELIQNEIKYVVFHRYTELRVQQNRSKGNTRDLLHSPSLQPLEYNVLIFKYNTVQKIKRKTYLNAICEQELSWV